MTEWTQAIVLQRLIEAHRLYERTERTGAEPRRRASDVPPHVHTDEDRLIVQRARHEFLKLEGYFSDDGVTQVKPIPLDWGAMPAPDMALIDRAAVALSWPAQFVADQRRRLALVAFVVFKCARRQGFAAALNTRLRRAGFPHLSRTVAYELKDQALGDVTQGLRTQVHNMHRTA